MSPKAEADKVSLLLDALFLARKLTTIPECATTPYTKGYFWYPSIPDYVRRDPRRREEVWAMIECAHVSDIHRLHRITKKAWERYNRRALWFHELSI